MPPTGRLFFALWPGHQPAAALHRLANEQAARTGGRVMATDSLHLTLAFLGAIGPDRLAAAIDTGHRIASLASPALALTLDHLDHWPRPGIVVSAGPLTAPLDGLVTALHEALNTAGFRLEKRPFRPHITLLRKVDPVLPGALLPCRIELAASNLCLIESVPKTEGGMRYTQIAGWPFGGLQEISGHATSAPAGRESSG